MNYTYGELRETVTLMHRLRSSPGAELMPGDERMIRQSLKDALSAGVIRRDIFGLNPVVLSLQTAVIAVEETGLKRDGLMAVMLYPCFTATGIDDGNARHPTSNLSPNVSSVRATTRVAPTLNSLIESTIRLPEQELSTLNSQLSTLNSQLSTILRGLVRVQELYRRHPVVESDNFRNLLLSFAEDMRVILIMIADRVNLMRQIRDVTDDDARRRVSREAAGLYAPLAHKLGLYRLKSELEDLSLKYLEHDVYYMIKDKLNETKRSRDAYIEAFIAPIERKLREAGLNCHIKGRTKSIHSIRQKMKKQKCAFEGIYDLFAIRVILDAPADKEKAQCWQVYSIVTDMYQPNPRRLRDWLSVPKSNGYESLHITVLGPENRWVEVQIRSERMDEIAERGAAAHWRYKGVRGEGGLDAWLADMRSALENSDDGEAAAAFRSALYEDEVYVFTPKGDLLKFPKGATVLDFAYHIHSKVGNGCTGARINGRIVTLRYVLRSGDRVEILTSASQRPHAEWIGMVKTARAKSKIRLALKETQVKEAAIAKEMIERRLKNRKTEMSESVMSRLIKKLGFKETRDFYRRIADGSLDVNTVIEHYQELLRKEQDDKPAAVRSAAGYTLDAAGDERGRAGADGTPHTDDVLVIDRNLKGVSYQLARCCQPVYGDEVFGFVTVNGGIKIHRADCPNAPDLRRRFGYRVVKARWSGKGTAQYGVTLRIVGNDDIGIVNNITSIISKEEKIMMRNINIDSSDGLFRGNLTVNVEDLSRLEQLLRKLRTVKGVKQVTRI